MDNQDTKFMQAALKLARRGIGAVEPNPAVGCVIVKSDRIIGKSWHKKFGGLHAEINALEDCRKKGNAPVDATIYITLEPCCHQGKTGPCTDALIQARPARVVIATEDPSTHANGQGIRILQQAGITIKTDICRDEARLLNAPFFKYAKTGKSWVILKWAQSIDGKLAFSQGEKKWISNEKSRKHAHVLRRRTQAIIVGINTVTMDNPLLTPRPSQGRNPLRIVMDNTLRLPLNCQLLKTAHKHPFMVYTQQHAAEKNPHIVNNLMNRGAELLTYTDQYNHSNSAFLLDTLAKRGCQQVLIEGGPALLASFLDQGLFDEIHVYIAPILLGSQGTVDITKPLDRLQQTINLLHIAVHSLDNDIHLCGYHDKSVDVAISAL
jgi:diaminohydroxyphosphoribosylaminopyrimidine deaminase/5-amino-6-(5-phosphoribosylamino)uracil reductase